MHDRAERVLREHGDDFSRAIGVGATSFGAALFATGFVLNANADWGAVDCPRCFPTALAFFGGAQLLFIGAITLSQIGSSHGGRGHRQRLRSAVDALLHASDRAADSAKRARLTIGASLLVASAAHVAGAVALFAMGTQRGFDDDAREALGGAALFLGAWLGTAGVVALGARSLPELAIAPTRQGATFVLGGRF